MVGLEHLLGKKNKKILTFIEVDMKLFKDQGCKSQSDKLFSFITLFCVSLTKVSIISSSVCVGMWALGAIVGLSHIIHLNCLCTIRNKYTTNIYKC